MNMKTRSQTYNEVACNEVAYNEVACNEVPCNEVVCNEVLEKPVFEVNIDFDEASKIWKANKKPIGGGQYMYVCTKGKLNGICGKKCYKTTEFCWSHRNTCNK